MLATANLSFQSIGFQFCKKASALSILRGRCPGHSGKKSAIHLKSPFRLNKPVEKHFWKENCIRYFIG
jgi:hypothetical protein